MAARAGWMTLGRFFALLVGAIAALLVVLLAAFYVSSRGTIVRASQRLMEQAGRLIVERMSEHLGEAERAVTAVERQVEAGLARPADPDSMAAALARELLARP